ncbi:MAG: translocation/assembly module TamB domain-containing protein [Burkholderiaceae bacterium]|jgi:translocation and assembly module TamB|nr:translocation/assembly module TamB domain-containing protein [Burkholderiaceae bacterium]
MEDRALPQAADDRPASAGSPSPAKPWRVLRALLWTLAGMVLVLLLAVLALWIWMGREGSLATALRWAGAQQPISADGVSGNLRGAGRVHKLTWEQDGLRVEVHDAQWRWSPAALLTRTLQIDDLGAGRVVIDDRSPPAPPPASPPVPPSSFALPLKLQLRALHVGELRWVGPPLVAAQDIAGRLDYDGARYRLQIDRVQVQSDASSGRFSASATLAANAPLNLEATLDGALTAPPLEDGRAPLPLTLQARVSGPLTELRAQADLRAEMASPSPLAEEGGEKGNSADASRVPDQAPAPSPQPSPANAAAARTAAAPADDGRGGGGGESSPASDDTPQAHIDVRIAPWAAQPLPEAHLRAQALNAAMLWAAAPLTRLSGQFDLAPLPADAPGWAVQADLRNDASGPWDQHRLPLGGLQTDLTWATSGALNVRTLKADIGGGTLESSGTWTAPTQQADARWRIDTRLDGIDPVQLHTQVTALPIDGTLSVSGAGTAIDFDAALQARKAPARSSANTLNLRDLLAQGQWADGLLTLKRLQLRTSDAELSGSASLRPADLGGSADLRVSAPGASLAITGEAQPERGAGKLRAAVTDAARLLAWAQKLPGAGGALTGMAAHGRATLDADWRGGWRDPTLNARLSAPQIDWHANKQQSVQVRDLQVHLSGKQTQAELDVSGHVAQDARQLDVRLSVTGGRDTPGAPLDQSAWHARIGTLQAGVHDPALGKGLWRIASRQPLTFNWSPQSGGRFDASAGELALHAPDAAAPALLTWGPAYWRAGELRTTGRLTGLPLQWLNLLPDAPLAQAGVGGDVVIEGGWDATLGQQPRLSAHIGRASGDLILLATDPDTGVQTRVHAGLHQARLALASQGRALDLQLAWDSERAGKVDGQLRTELSTKAGADGSPQWSWPDSAPLQGRLQARLPQLAAWSTLAPPGWRLRGALTADAHIGGTRAAPLVSGSLNADRLALRSVADGVQLGKGRLRARFDGTRLVIDEFLLHGMPLVKDANDAKDSGGLLRASGEAGWIDGRAQARLNATLEQLRASISAEREVTLSGQAQAALDGRQLQANARLHIDRARIVLPEESAPSLDNDVIVHGAGGLVRAGKDAPGAIGRPAPPQPDKADAAPASPFTAAVDVQIDLGPDFRLQGMGIDTRLAGALTFSSSGPLTAAPRLTGIVRTEDGSFRAYSQELTIHHGQITFSGEIGNPTLDIIALRPLPTSEQQVGIQVMGTALLPRVRLYSQPTLSDSEALAWLLLGHAAPSSGAESAMLQSAALALLGGRNARSFASRVGLDELSVNRQQEGDTSFTLGKRLSKRLYAAYEYSLSGTGATLLIFYDLSRRWRLRGQAGESAALDLIYRLTFD